MYSTHRGMVPAPNSRLTELLDQLRQEFESQSRSTGEFEHQSMSIAVTCLLRVSATGVDSTSGSSIGTARIVN